MIPNKWEIWLVNMPFEEGIGAKVRPALVLDPKQGLIIVGKMTTHAPRSNFPYEYQLQDWAGAGLKCPTTLRLSQRPLLEVSQFIKKIGDIQPIDFMQIHAILCKIMNDEDG